MIRIFVPHSLNLVSRLFEQATRIIHFNLIQSVVYRACDCAFKTLDLIERGLVFTVQKVLRCYMTRFTLLLEFLPPIFTFPVPPNILDSIPNLETNIILHELDSTLLWPEISRWRRSNGFVVSSICRFNVWTAGWRC
jgi:hypothetical protein